MVFENAMDFFQTAIDHEEVFGNILRDLRDNRTKRPMGLYVPEDLETDLALDEIFKKYCSGAMGVFTVTNFTITSEFATIAFKDVAILSGGGAALKYSIQADNSVSYLELLFSFMC